MTDFSFSTSAPPHWDALCDEKGALFGSRGWQKMLESSFRCRTIYASSKDTGLAITVFTAGPFRIGYAGFPVGNAIGNIDSIAGVFAELRKSGLRVTPVCVRLPVSAFGPTTRLDLPAQTNPETAIIELQDWDLASVSKNLRRDIRKAERSGLLVHETTEAAIGNELFDIYSGTVQRHGGSLRYSANYFRALIELAESRQRLRVFLARSGSDIAGFAVTARHENTTYYLHGGANTAYRQHSPSDLLLSNAILLAKQDGSECFNLMASPFDQPTLVRYKEKWGGETRNLLTYTLALRASYPLFRVAEKLYGMARS